MRNFRWICIVVMPSLSVAQTSQVHSILSSAQEIYCSTAARLYSASQNGWEYTGVCGVVSLILEHDLYYIRISNLHDNQVYFEQELFLNFTFEHPLAFFVTFEGHSITYGLSFADEGEAEDFVSNLAICAQHLQVQVSNFNPLPICIEMKEENPRVVDMKKKRKKTSKIQLGRLFGRKGKKSNEISISSPTDFQHHGHIGWEENKKSAGKLSQTNIPQEWKKLYSTIGFEPSSSPIIPSSLPTPPVVAPKAPSVLASLPEVHVAPPPPLPCIHAIVPSPSAPITAGSLSQKLKALQPASLQEAPPTPNNNFFDPTILLPIMTKIRVAVDPEWTDSEGWSSEESSENNSNSSSE